MLRCNKSHDHIYIIFLVPSIKTSFIIPIGCLTKTNRKTTLKYLEKPQKRNQQLLHPPPSNSQRKRKKKKENPSTTHKIFLHQGCSILYKVVCFRFKTNHPFNCKGRNEDKRGLQYVQTLTNTI